MNFSTRYNSELGALNEGISNIYSNWSERSQLETSKFKTAWLKKQTEKLEKSREKYNNMISRDEANEQQGDEGEQQGIEETGMAPILKSAGKWLGNKTGLNRIITKGAKSVGRGLGEGGVDFVEAAGGKLNDLAEQGVDKAGDALDRMLKPDPRGFNDDVEPNSFEMGAPHSKSLYPGEEKSAEPEDNRMVTSDPVSRPQVDPQGDQAAMDSRNADRANFAKEQNAHSAASRGEGEDQSDLDPTQEDVDNYNTEEKSYSTAEQNAKTTANTARQAENNAGDDAGDLAGDAGADAGADAADDLGEATEADLLDDPVGDPLGFLAGLGLAAFGVFGAVSGAEAAKKAKAQAAAAAAAAAAKAAEITAQKMPKPPPLARPSYAGRFISPVESALTN
jgi:hypothetical protein